MAMTNQEKFKILADQIKIANQLDQDILEQGELTRIDVSSKNRSWMLQIKLPRFLSYEDYLLFTNAVTEEFKSIAHVEWQFEIEDTSNQDEHALKYFNYCIDQTNLSPKVKGQLKQKKLIMSGDVIKVVCQNDVEGNHFDKVCNGSLVKAFKQCGFNINKVIFETNNDNSDEDLASLEAHIQEEDEKSAREATEKLEKNES